MVSEAHALARYELVRVLTAYSGIVTANGAADGSTLFDSNLIGVNDFVTGRQILIGSGPAMREMHGVSVFAPLTGQITFDATFSVQITQGTVYRIVNISNMSSALIEILKGQGLCYQGIVTAIPGANQFEATLLAGKGNSFFNNYYVYVVRDAGGAGAAPQGEWQPVTAYVSVGGVFTHGAFTVNLAIGDTVLLIHSAIYAALMASYGDMIWFDDGLGVAGIAYPTGTPAQPSSVVADCLTIALALNITRLHIAGTTFQIPDVLESYEFFGTKDLLNPTTVDLNGQDVDGCAFHGLLITGLQAGAAWVNYEDCVFDTATGLAGVAVRCGLSGTNGLRGGDGIDFHKCRAFMGAATITVNNPMIANFFDFEGELNLVTMTGGAVVIYSSVGTRVVINASCTAGAITIYGDAIIDNQSGGTVVNDYTINKQVDQIIQGHKGILETWQDEFIDDTIWAVTDPATGVPWARGVAGAFLYCQCTPNANETTRIRSIHQWIQNWMATPTNLMNKRLCIEFEMLLGVPANVDNAISVFGLLPGIASTRATQNIIAFALIGDALQTVTDAGGVETVNTGFGETLTNHNKFKIEIRESEVRFYLNEAPIATHATNVPAVPMYFNCFLDTEAGGGCAFAFGRIRIWDETIERY